MYLGFLIGTPGVIGLKSIGFHPQSGKLEMDRIIWIWSCLIEVPKVNSSEAELFYNIDLLQRWPNPIKSIEVYMLGILDRLFFKQLGRYVRLR